MDGHQGEVWYTFNWSIIAWTFYCPIGEQQADDFFNQATVDGLSKYMARCLLVKLATVPRAKSRRRRLAASKLLMFSECTRLLKWC